MTAEPPLPTPPPPRKRRLGCVAWIGIGLLAGLLFLVGAVLVGIHHERRALVERATAALLANDADAALAALHEAHEGQPDDEGIARMYEAAQQKWVDSIDRLIADKTPAQRYSTLGEFPVKEFRKHLAEPLATTFGQFVERNAVETQVQIQATVERAMDLVEAGKFNEGWKEMETLRVCSSFPGLSEIWRGFDAYYADRLLMRASELGQHGQVAAAREDLEWARRNRKPTPEALVEAGFLIDLGDYSLKLNQAVNAATKGDPAAARARLVEAQPLLVRLLASPELQSFYRDLPEKDRGTPLISQLVAAQFVVEKFHVAAAPR